MFNKTTLSIAIVLGLGACAAEKSVQDLKEWEADAGIDEIVLLEDGNNSRTAKEHRLEEVVLTANKRDANELRVADQAMSSDFYVNPERVAGAISKMSQSAFLFAPTYEVNTENYLDIDENGIKQVATDPVSTFSIDVDTASYSNVRRMLRSEGRLPPVDAVKLEEMINYFSYSYPVSKSLDQPFSVSTEVAPAPWNRDKLLMQIGLKGFEPKKSDRPDANLVFLVDVSGSMQSPNKLPLLKKSLGLLVNQMNGNDRIALVVYAGSAGLVLESTPGSEKQKILRAINNLEAGGSTHGSAGIHLAYEIAEENLIDGGINRILIASDGDMNVGTTSVDGLKELIKEKRQSGIALTTLGFGTGNYNDAIMEQLADVGNGNAAYIDSLLEAQKVLVNEMQSTLLTIAKDVKIQVEFNPSVVAEYRLLGYENRLLKREDFRNDKVDAGDIGAGHTVTALYEITLKGSEGAMIPDLRYQKSETDVNKNSHELAYVNLRYKKPEETKSHEFGQAVRLQSIEKSFDASHSNLRFAAAVAAFGQLLRDSDYTQGMSYDQVLEIARSARDSAGYRDEHGYRSEFLSLVELAKSLSTKSLASLVPEAS